MMNWAEYEEDKRIRQRTIILPLILWLGVIACVIGILGSLGCATPKESPSPRTEVCYLRLLGQTEDGMSVVATHCMTPEQFKGAQQ